MKTTIDMAREANLAKYGDGLREGVAAFINALERFEALVRADEREQGQKWFDAVTAQHKQLILAEREACAELVYNSPPSDEYESQLKAVYDAIRARGETT
jgi:hypothetical protein